MVHPNWSKFALFLLLGIFSQTSAASDMAKEKRWADQIVDSLMVGEAEWLPAGQDKILSLYTEHETEQAKGGVIVLHGIGVHPNWDQIIRPVRSRLPEYGWSTLSVQLPILPNDAKQSEYEPLFDEVAPRINAAVKFLKDKGINNIVIVAHSLGSAMAAYYLKDKPDPSVHAFIAIGASGAHFKNSDKNYFKSLETIKIPVMDIYGSSDLPDVVEAADRKLSVARKAGNKNYTQIKIEGADHFFNNKQDELVKRIRGWLKTNVTEK